MCVCVKWELGVGRRRRGERGMRMGNEGEGMRMRNEECRKGREGGGIEDEERGFETYSVE